MTAPGGTTGGPIAIAQRGGASATVGAATMPVGGSDGASGSGMTGGAVANLDAAKQIPAWQAARLREAR